MHARGHEESRPGSQLKEALARDPKMAASSPGPGQKQGTNLIVDGDHQSLTLAHLKQERSKAAGTRVAKQSELISWKLIFGCPPLRVKEKGAIRNSHTLRLKEARYYVLHMEHISRPLQAC